MLSSILLRVLYSREEFQNFRAFEKIPFNSHLQKLLYHTIYIGRGWLQYLVLEMCAGEGRFRARIPLLSLANLTCLPANRHRPTDHGAIDKFVSEETEDVWDQGKEGGGGGERAKEEKWPDRALGGGGNGEGRRISAQREGNAAEAGWNTPSRWQKPVVAFSFFEQDLRNKKVLVFCRIGGFHTHAAVGMNFSSTCVLVREEEASPPLGQSDGPFAIHSRGEEEGGGEKKKRPYTALFPVYYVRPHLGSLWHGKRRGGEGEVHFQIASYFFFFLLLLPHTHFSIYIPRGEGRESSGFFVDHVLFGKCCFSHLALFGKKTPQQLITN